MARQKWPLIYVRGYAMTRGEIDDTTADPFCGFNVGSTVYRARPDRARSASKFVFESPLVRLGMEHGYRSVYDNGFDIVDPEWKSEQQPGERVIPPESIVIYRYYDGASTLLGSGRTPRMQDFARGLGTLILRVRDLVCAGNRIDPAAFRCYLVAHSMGGLVCRTFLQNRACGSDAARACVDKLFTYGTPHNGIEAAGFNVPRWLEANDISSFNRDTMAEYLDLEPQYRKTGRVDWLPEKAFPSSRVFCMVGTNRTDYEAGMGLSRAFVGNGSDGLVRVDNASVWGTDEAGAVSAPCATAYAYRAHSGAFGIVNSEEAYQNLARFLFGDVRVDVWADIVEVGIPRKVRDKAAGQKVEALYQFEVLAAPRGKRWYLTRRVPEEDSVACRTLEQLQAASAAEPCRVHLSTVFLADSARVDLSRRSLGYAVTFGVRVPEYEVAGAFFGSDHMEGGSIFRDTVAVELTPGRSDKEDWSVKATWLSDGAETRFGVSAADLSAGKDVALKFHNSTLQGGISGSLRFRVSAWS